MTANYFRATYANPRWNFIPNLNDFEEINCEKKLCIGKPPIISYPVHPSHLSIVTACENHEAWLYSNYIQIACPPEFPQETNKVIDFFNYDTNAPFHNYSPYAIEMKENGFLIEKDIVVAIIQFIENGYYIKIYLDDYFIPFRKRVFHQNHTPHELFLYGYDSDLMIFHVLGYDEKSGFIEAQITFNEFKEAFMSANRLIRVDREEYHWMQYIYLYAPQNADLAFDLKQVVSLLDAYLNSTSFQEMRNVYEALKEFYDYQLQFHDFDIRPFYLLWEHKKVMLDRIEYISKNIFKREVEYIVDAKDLQRDFLKLRNVVLKGNLLKKHMKNKLFCSMLDSYVRKEIVILNRLLHDLYVFL
ncbi:MULTISPECIES: hypothetical protein [unclassified Paenibacillus]|uniref:hypothetical protein n=1 Tax=unclassified Paenibacillus TaxID=185978 RepID=UPI0030FBE9F4